ncbi:unnamed protein product [Ceratitis capitata]|uniref:(Mediterranean fruit fly) hypothetical protein n=1 Tax=Ceratitis capitata TaxID=7213 RepID=A0A811UUT3_CERCA|nr:unnamed protein product [Ceratitis capitata]
MIATPHSTTSSPKQQRQSQQLRLSSNCNSTSNSNTTTNRLAYSPLVQMKSTYFIITTTIVAAPTAGIVICPQNQNPPTHNDVINRCTNKCFGQQTRQQDLHNHKS